MSLSIHSLAERPDLRDRFDGIEGAWPEFMLQDPVSQHYGTAIDLFPDLHLVAVDADGRAVARLHAVPVTADVANLPDRGWDWALESAVQQPSAQRSMVSLIEARAWTPAGVAEESARRCCPWPANGTAPSGYAT